MTFWHSTSVTYKTTAIATMIFIVNFTRLVTGNVLTTVFLQENHIKLFRLLACQAKEPECNKYHFDDPKHTKYLIICILFIGVLCYSLE